MSQWVYTVVPRGRFVIYGLFDPRTGELRYIGKSVNSSKRAYSHTKSSDLKRHGRTPKTAWIKSLLRLGLRPQVQILKECATAEVLYDEEQRTIALYRQMAFVSLT